jgi:hypothetical protein
MIYNVPLKARGEQHVVVRHDKEYDPYLDCAGKTGAR